MSGWEAVGGCVNVWGKLETTDERDCAMPFTFT